jgi:hypothetical protein
VIFLPQIYSSKGILLQIYIQLSTVKEIQVSGDLSTPCPDLLKFRLWFSGLYSKIFLFDFYQILE